VAADCRAAEDANWTTTSHHGNPSWP